MDFTFTFHNSRSGSPTTFSLKKTDDGWHLDYLAINGDCKPDGETAFSMNFRQDSISYPSSFPDALEWLWGEIDSGNISQQEAQKMLDDLARWVEACDQAQPKWKGYNSIK